MCNTLTGLARGQVPECMPELNIGLCTGTASSWGNWWSLPTKSCELDGDVWLPEAWLAKTAKPKCLKKLHLVTGRLPGWLLHVRCVRKGLECYERRSRGDKHLQDIQTGEAKPALTFAYAQLRQASLSADSKP